MSNNLEDFAYTRALDVQRLICTVATIVAPIKTAAMLSVRFWAPVLLFDFI